MNKIMKLVLSFLTFTLVSTSVIAGNSVYLQQDNQEGQSIFIKQDGTNNKVGVSTSYPFIVDGNDLTVIIRQIGDGNKTDWSNHNSFKGDIVLDPFAGTFTTCAVSKKLERISAWPFRTTISCSK